MNKCTKPFWNFQPQLKEIGFVIKQYNAVYSTKTNIKSRENALLDKPQTIEIKIL